MDTEIVVNEIFTSVNGEVSMWDQGVPVTFIRMQGCNLRCSYCDTPESIDFSSPSSRKMEVKSVINSIPKECRKVVITGGEPMEQRYFFNLLDRLVDENIEVSVETNGTGYIPDRYRYMHEVSWVVDYKIQCKDLMMEECMGSLGANSRIKFMIEDLSDLEFAFAKFEELAKTTDAGMSISVIGNDERIVKEYMSIMKKRKKFDLGINVQIHKLLKLK